MTSEYPTITPDSPADEKLGGGEPIRVSEVKYPTIAADSGAGGGDGGSTPSDQPLPGEEPAAQQPQSPLYFGVVFGPNVTDERFAEFRQEVKNDLEHGGVERGIEWVRLDGKRPLDPNVDLAHVVILYQVQQGESRPTVDAVSKAVRDALWGPVDTLYADPWPKERTTLCFLLPLGYDADELVVSPRALTRVGRQLSDRTTGLRFVTLVHSEGLWILPATIPGPRARVAYRVALRAEDDPKSLINAVDAAMEFLLPADTQPVDKIPWTLPLLAESEHPTAQEIAKWARICIFVHWDTEKETVESLIARLELEREAVRKVRPGPGVDSVLMYPHGADEKLLEKADKAWDVDDTLLYFLEYDYDGIKGFEPDADEGAFVLTNTADDYNHIAQKAFRVAVPGWQRAHEGAVPREPKIKVLVLPDDPKAPDWDNLNRQMITATWQWRDRLDFTIPPVPWTEGIDREFWLKDVQHILFLASGIVSGSDTAESLANLQILRLERLTDGFAKYRRPTTVLFLDPFSSGSDIVTREANRVLSDANWNIRMIQITTDERGYRQVLTIVNPLLQRLGLQAAFEGPEPLRGPVAPPPPATKPGPQPEVKQGPPRRPVASPEGPLRRPVASLEVKQDVGPVTPALPQVKQEEAPREPVAEPLRRPVAPIEGKRGQPGPLPEQSPLPTLPRPSEPRRLRRPVTRVPEGRPGARVPEDRVPEGRPVAADAEGGLPAYIRPWLDMLKRLPDAQNVELKEATPTRVTWKIGRNEDKNVTQTGRPEDADSTFFTSLQTATSRALGDKDVTWQNVERILLDSRPGMRTVDSPMDDHGRPTEFVQLQDAETRRMVRFAVDRLTKKPMAMMALKRLQVQWTSFLIRPSVLAPLRYWLDEHPLRHVQGVPEDQQVEADRVHFFGGNLAQAMKQKGSRPRIDLFDWQGQPVTSDPANAYWGATQTLTTGPSSDLADLIIELFSVAPNGPGFAPRKGMEVDAWYEPRKIWRPAFITGATAGDEIEVQFEAPTQTTGRLRRNLVWKRGHRVDQSPYAIGNMLEYWQDGQILPAWIVALQDDHALLALGAPPTYANLNAGRVQWQRVEALSKSRRFRPIGLAGPNLVEATQWHESGKGRELIRELGKAGAWNSDRTRWTPAHLASASIDYVEFPAAFPHAKPLVVSSDESRRLILFCDVRQVVQDILSVVSADLPSTLVPLSPGTTTPSDVRPPAVNPEWAEEPVRWPEVNPEWAKAPSV